MDSSGKITNDTIRQTMTPKTTTTKSGLEQLMERRLLRRVKRRVKKQKKVVYKWSPG